MQPQSIHDLRRYRRLLRFFAAIIAHLLLIDILLGRVPWVRQWVQSSRPRRLRTMARRFRTLAVAMGGVLIKLGQFLSARVDVLPSEITEELAGLQDEVPAVPYPAIAAVIEQELRDWLAHFVAVEQTPLAAASLGQAHRARLRRAESLPAQDNTNTQSAVSIDLPSDDLPSDELNHAPRAGMNFGYPYCHAGDLPDPQFGAKHPCSAFTAPAQKLGPHVASLGMRFYTGTMFPPRYRNQIFIAEHGSWNRSSKIGYRITLVRLESGKAVAYEPFATGWLQGETVTGRPSDVLVLPDGSLLIADDYAGAIYRISYRG